MLFKTRGKGDWHIVRLTPAKLLEITSEITSQMSKGEKVGLFFYNKTEDGQFRIEVKL